MALLKSYVKEFSKVANTENIKLNVIGDITALEEDLQNSINESINRTKDNTGIVFNIAFIISALPP